MPTRNEGPVNRAPWHPRDAFRIVPYSWRRWAFRHLHDFMCSGFTYSFRGYDALESSELRAGSGRQCRLTRIQQSSGLVLGSESALVS
jgi:hypothetical protein